MKANIPTFNRYFTPAIIGLVIIINPNTSHAFGVLDYLDMSLKAVNKTGSKAYEKVMDRFIQTAKNSVSLVYEGVNDTVAPLNPDNRTVITQMVDAVITPNGKSTAYNAASSNYLDNFHLIKSALSDYESAATAVNFASTAKSLDVDYSKMKKAAESLGKKIAQGQSGVLDAMVGLYYGTKTLLDIASIDEQLKEFTSNVATKKLSATEQSELIAAVIGQSGLYTQQELVRIGDKNDALYKRLILQEAAIEYLREQTGKSPADLNNYAVIKATYSDGGFFGRASYTEIPSTYGYVYSTNDNLMSGGTWGGDYSDFAPIIEAPVDQIEQPVLSGRVGNDETINVIELNTDSKLNAIENAANNESSTGSAYWSGNFVLNYVNGSGIFTTFGYGDGGFSAPSKPEANTAATLTYYHLGERNYQVDIRSVDYPGDYSYTAWGSWTEGDQRLAAFEADYAYHSGTSKLTPWVAVQRMLPEDVSRLSGTATYSGVLSGVMIGDAGASDFQSGTGMFGMTANFNNDTVTGAVIVMRSPSSPAWATGNFSTNLNSDIDGGLEFNSQLTGTGISNAENWHSQIRGEFGGPQANEAGGMWAITKTDGSQATGTFHAKKETN